MINFASLMNHYWHFGAHVSELCRPGDYLTYNYFDQTLVLYNDGSQVIAFDNICPHRGAQFFTARRGNSIATCKYHGLTIANGAISMFDQRFADTCSKNLNKFSTKQCGEYVFFAIAPQISLEDQFGNAMYELIESISFDCSKLVDTDDYIFKSNALVAVENALEPAHLPFVHADTLDTLHLTSAINEFHGLNSIVKFSIGNDEIRTKLDRLEPLFDVGTHRFKGYMSIHMFPFGFVSSTYGYSYSIQSFFPRSENECYFNTQMYIPNLKKKSGEAGVAFFVDSASGLNRKVFLEDQKICASIKYSSWVRLFNEPLMEDEVKIRHFRNSLERSFDVV
jgi:phenylpropionate dioxygenase-like ring-hydroxylating dioxygenase large terminal subunit